MPVLHITPFYVLIYLLSAVSYQKAITSYAFLFKADSFPYEVDA